MRETITVDAIEWLRSAPVPIEYPRRHVLPAFDQTKPLTVVRYTGPHTFYRMAGYSESAGEMTDPYGSWWIEEETLNAMYSKIERFDMFEGWVPREHLATMKSLPMHYRALAAICEDWNDFREQVRLELPLGETIAGLAGMVAPQPLREKMSRTSRKTPWLPGGVEQVYFKQPRKKDRSPTNPGSINPFWIGWVKLF